MTISPSPVFETNASLTMLCRKLFASLCVRTNLSLSSLLFPT
ncbi:hypothetical protein MGSAQ_000594 [marine sediment metagenome]|uniref:Uncharacterized protein n=1 Tax=marine sediment metagenome TaxID=412755 RepID=A0A1B6NWV9_9ZZZZ